MNDIHFITVGFAILAKYESTGEVNVDRSETIYAGPEELDEDDYDQGDRANLEANYWHFNDTIQRWGYGL